MIASIALALIATAFAVATVLLLMLLIDFLARRADVIAGLLIGSTLVEAFFAKEVPRSPCQATCVWDRPMLSRRSSCALLSHGFLKCGD